MEIRYIDPLKDLGPLLLTVEKPARYAGGEYGRLCNPQADSFNTMIAFPDLYEIGMSNQALRILYNGLNRMEGISCDRAFAPAPDFEALLREKKIPLYGLDTGICLKDVDLLMFTLGYELGITNFFTMLDVSGIPLRREERGEDDPILIMGGPCVSNPLPYSAFVDAFWIGEAEAGFFELTGKLAEIKKTGGTREALLKRLADHPSVWTRGKAGAVRAVDAEFSGLSRGKDRMAVFPVPSMKVVHHHGSVEIMRGCPNGCRFCHAGYWYRPMRQKSAELVEAETEAFVRLGGYKEITLSSLSSGDYQHLDALIDSLNAKYRKQHVSFQLPSLKVSTFSLGLLEKVSELRKSGLTFAVETPSDFWQMAINKQVAGEDLVSILREAKRKGWRGVKFYFMIGLPLENETPSEEEEIAAFIEKIVAQTGMHFNINVGTFVPKPHTPFQWAGQISREEAGKKFNFLRARLKPRGHKLGVQDPLISVLEGIASRGDERAGQFFEEAFQSGCRLDSWNEYLKREVWEELLEKHKSMIEDILGRKDQAIVLPWSFIKSGVSDAYFSKEMKRSYAGEITSPCMNNCNNPCGACNDSIRMVKNIIQNDVNYQVEKGAWHHSDPDTNRIIFSFSKQNSAVFQPHLGLLEIFSMSFIRADIPVLYTQGFNPLPRLEIVSPLSLGLKAKGEMAIIDTEIFVPADVFRSTLNLFFPDGLEVMESMNVLIPYGKKKHSLSSLLWGYEYAGADGKSDFVKAKDEKAYRLSRIGPNASIYDLERLSVLACPAPQNEDLSEDKGVSYFEVYRELYTNN